MTIKYLIREDGLIAEWHDGIKDFTGLTPYEFPIEKDEPEVKETTAPKKGKKEKLDGNPDNGSN